MPPSPNGRTKPVTGHIGYTVSPGGTADTMNVTLAVPTSTPAGAVDQVLVCAADTSLTGDLFACANRCTPHGAAGPPLLNAWVTGTEATQTFTLTGLSAGSYLLVHLSGDAGLLAATGALAPPTYTVCAAGCAYSSVQAAIDAVADGAQADSTVTLAPGDYHDTTATGAFSIPSGTRITIVGATATDAAEDTVPATVLHGDATHGVLIVRHGAHVVLTDLKFTDGHSTSGGGISNYGVLTLNGRTMITGNAGDRSLTSGGGINNDLDGTVTLNDHATITGNTATSDGGEIWSPPTGRAIQNGSDVTISDNHPNNCAGVDTTSVPACN